MEGDQQCYITYIIIGMVEGRGGGGAGERTGLRRTRVESFGMTFYYFFWLFSSGSTLCLLLRSTSQRRPSLLPPVPGRGLLVEDKDRTGQGRRTRLGWGRRGRKTTSVQIQQEKTRVLADRGVEERLGVASLTWL